MRHIPCFIVRFLLFKQHPQFSSICSSVACLPLSPFLTSPSSGSWIGPFRSPSSTLGIPSPSTLVDPSRAGFPLGSSPPPSGSIDGPEPYRTRSHWTVVETRPVAFPPEGWRRRRDRIQRSNPVHGPGWTCRKDRPCANPRSVRGT